jgi:transcriptional regulator with XRE-family HTH domain
MDDLAAALERAATGMTQSALVRTTGLSARTLRQLMDPDTTRVFGRPTLNKLDKAFGWADGTAWRAYRRGQAPPDRAAEVAAEALSLIEERFAALAAEPPWVAEWLDAGRSLSPRDRALALQFVRRLGEG